MSSWTRSCRSTRRTACTARPATSRTRRRTSPGSRPRAAADPTTRACDGGGVMEAARASHAAPDRHTRILKARKIELLLGEGALRDGAALLDIGAGSGWIAHYFGTHPRHRLAVSAVDARDERVAKEGYAFRQVDGTALPFPDASFDVVLSNHVIEHVGGEAEQLRHLAEARRVLRPGGTFYLAVPNRWSLVEPHYRLPFLSWLPGGLANAWVRAT